MTDDDVTARALADGFTNEERALLLRALFELRITVAGADPQSPTGQIPDARIDGLVAKLGGDPHAVFFGGDG
jgi:hypothetical protein